MRCIRSTALFCATLLMALALHGQSWAPAGVPFKITEMANIYADTVGDAIYFCGESSLNNDFDMSDGAVPYYTDGQWDTLGVFDGRPQAIVRWHDTLVVAGNFDHINGVFFDGIAGRVGEQWVPFGSLHNVYRLKVIGDDLFAIGAIQTADGVPCQGVAKRTGGGWKSIGQMDVYTTPNVQDIVAWNDLLITTGVIRFSNGLPKDIAYMADSIWHPLGPGIPGAFSTGRSLAICNGDLFVSGSIDIAAGNAGHGIMRWDGDQFHPVGSGLQGITNDFSILCGAVELEVRDGLLWAAGSFQNAGHVPAPGIATWDGSEWCGLPLGPQPQCNSIEFFHDTLFAGCFHYLDGEGVNCAVRFTGDSYADTCSTVVGIPEPHPSAAISAVANGNKVLIFGLPAGDHRCEVYDATGRCTVRQRVTSQGATTVLLVPQLASGAYLLRTDAGAVPFLVP